MPLSRASTRGRYSRIVGVTFMDLSVVYTNDPVWVEHSIHVMELLLAVEKYKVAGFDLEYTRGRVGSFPKVVVAQDMRAPPRPRLPLLPGHKALRAFR